MTSVSAQSKSLNAFLLTRQWLETNAGLELVFWFNSAAGPLRLHLPRQEAVCFFPTEQTAVLEKILSGQKGWRTKPTELCNFAGEPVSALYFASQRSLFDNRDRLGIRDIY